MVLFDARFSPDGQRLLTASFDNTARLWDPATGQRTALFTHDAGLYSATFSPDGRWIATACADGKAHLWEVEQRPPAHIVLPQCDEVTQVAFSPSGQQIASASWRDEVRLWNLTTNSSILTTFAQPETSLALFSPDESRVLTVGHQGGSALAQLWNASTGQPLGSPLPLTPPVLAAAFVDGHDGILLAQADGQARWWNPPSGRTVEVPLHSPHPLRLAGFNRAGHRLAAIDQGGRLQCWKLEPHRAVALPVPLLTNATTFTFNQDGSQLAIATRQQQIHRLDAATGQTAGSPLTHSASLRSLAYSPQGSLLAATTGHRAQVWNLESGQPLPHAFKVDNAARLAWFSPDGLHLATTGEDRMLRLWNLETGQATTAPMVHSRALADLQFSRDGRRIFTLTRLDELRLWDAETGAPLSPSIPHPGARSGGTLRLARNGERILVSTRGPAAWIREFTPATNHLDQLILQAQALSGRRLDRQGVQVPSANPDLAATWTQGRRGPSPTSPAPAPSAPAHPAR